MLTLSIVSPTKKILEIECSEVTIPTSTGLITVLPKHAPLFSILGTGEVVVKLPNHEKEYVVVSGGFVNVENDKILILVDFGIHSSEMDEKIITEAKERAKKMLEESQSENLTKIAKANILHADLQLQFLPRHNHKNNV